MAGPVRSAVQRIPLTLPMARPPTSPEALKVVQRWGVPATLQAVSTRIVNEHTPLVVGVIEDALVQHGSQVRGLDANAVVVTTRGIILAPLEQRPGLISSLVSLLSPHSDKMDGIVRRFGGEPARRSSWNFRVGGARGAAVRNFMARVGTIDFLFGVAHGITEPTTLDMAINGLLRPFDMFAGRRGLADLHSALLMVDPLREDTSRNAFYYGVLASNAAAIDRILRSPATIAQLVRSGLDISQINIDVLGFSVRARRMLLDGGITTLGQLVENTEADLMRRGCTDKNLKHIKDVLQRDGLTLSTARNSSAPRNIRFE